VILVSDLSKNEITVIVEKKKKKARFTSAACTNTTPVAPANELFAATREHGLHNRPSDGNLRVKISSYLTQYSGSRGAVTIAPPFVSPLSTSGRPRSQPGMISWKANVYQKI
jgi:hypothetical protein